MIAVVLEQDLKGCRFAVGPSSMDADRAAICPHLSTAGSFRVEPGLEGGTQLRTIADTPSTCAPASMCRRSRNARRHARRYGHSEEPVVDFEFMKKAAKRRVAAAEFVQLLHAALELCEADPVSSRWAHRCFLLSMLRAESRRREKDANRVAEFVHSGAVELATGAMLQFGCDSCDVSDAVFGAQCAKLQWNSEFAGRAKFAAAGAATIAHVAASGGDGKAVILANGTVPVAIQCLRHLHAISPNVMRQRSLSPACLVELFVQSCRLIGNLCYGWGETVEAAKREFLIGDGQRLLAELLRELGANQAAAVQVLRWGSHALRNLVVRNPQLQDACGEAGAVDILGESMCTRHYTIVAQIVACKAVAFLVKDHKINQARAMNAGMVQLSLHLLRIASGNQSVGLLAVEIAEASCNMLAFLVEKNAKSAAAAVQAGAVGLLVQVVKQVCIVPSSQNTTKGGGPLTKQCDAIIRWITLALNSVFTALGTTENIVPQSMCTRTPDVDYGHLNTIGLMLQQCEAVSVLSLSSPVLRWKTRAVMEDCLVTIEYIVRNHAATPLQLERPSQEANVTRFEKLAKNK